MSFLLSFGRFLYLKMKQSVQKEDGVSPVVGVMLMLVVTIVIAAVVALFATSVVTDTQAAPVAVLEADVDTSWIQD